MRDIKNMETIQEKYTRLRSKLKNGMLILFEGTKPISDVIKISDSCEKTHSGIIVDVWGTFYIFDSNRGGVKPDRLSFRISEYPDGDFVIKQSLLPQEVIDLEVSKLLKESDFVIKYDFKNGTRSLINRSWLGRILGINLKIKPDKYHVICSVYTRKISENLELIHVVVLKNSLFFPEDYIRYEKNAITLE